MIEAIMLAAVVEEVCSEECCLCCGCKLCCEETLVKDVVLAIVAE